jgi:hypothetical protein
VIVTASSRGRGSVCYDNRTASMAIAVAIDVTIAART